MSLEAYFQSGGDGNDLTLHVQTLNEGPASFDIATYYPGDTFAGPNFVQFGAGTALPTAFVTALENIQTRDRWIFAGTRVTVVFTAPVFTDDTGDTQSWIAGTAITDVTVPLASGSPTPAYAVVGTLPGGLSFNTATRIISGAPTMGESGTITIRATNSEGFDDWTIAYNTVSTAVLASEVPDPESTLTAENAYSAGILASEVPDPESTLTAENAYSAA